VPSQIIDLPIPSPVQAWPQALYLHIPFCPTHCHYCDFAVVVGTEDLVARYLNYLEREIAFTPTAHQGLTTVYFGGGTPSLLTPDQVERLLQALTDRFGSLAGAEITLEANPGTLTLEKLRAYRTLGINRLSLGAQAFQEEILRQLGRGHDVREIYQAVTTLERAGFSNFSLDLMFGLPHQTLAQWQASLDGALALQPTHLSAYDLILEERTPFGRRYALGATPLPEEEVTIQMYLQLIERFTQAGYTHYEIASLARQPSRHNQVYWHNQPYYGLGVGATGYVFKERITRPRRLADYFKWVEAGIFTRDTPLSLLEELGETLMLGLRLVEGVDLARLSARFGEPAVHTKLAALRRMSQQGLVEEQAGRLKLIYPNGFLLANEVLQEVI